MINNVLQSVFIELNEGIDFIFIIDKYNRKDLAGVASNALFFLLFTVYRVHKNVFWKIVYSFDIFFQIGRDLYGNVSAMFLDFQG